MKRKKGLVVLLCMMACGLAFAAGTQENGPAETGTSLEFFSQKPEAVPVMNTLIEKFMNENPGISVTLTSTPDAGTVFRTRVATGDLPDISNSFPAEDMWKKLFDEGYLVDLTGEPFLDNIAEDTRDLASYKGRLFAMPMALSAYGIYYRKDIFRAYGLDAPSTYDELIACCRKLQANGVTPFSFANKDVGNIAQRFERLLGVINNDTDGEFRRIASGELRAEDSPTLKACADMMTELTEYGPKDSLAVDYDSSIADFVNGKAAMTISGTWALGTMRTGDVADLDSKVELIPFPNPVGETKVPINIDTSFSIASGTKDKASALKFLEFLSRTENAQIYADTEQSPNMVKGVTYNVVPHKKMVDILSRGDIFLTAVNFWPTGLREELRIPEQQLLMDGDTGSFLEAAGAAIAKYYNKEK